MPSVKQWANAVWFSLHSIAGTFPPKATEEQRQKAVELMNSLSVLLPCGICANHLAQDLKEHPVYPETETREKFEKYVYDLHNRVNIRTGKHVQHTFEEVQQAFSPYNVYKGFGGYQIKGDEETAGAELTAGGQEIKDTEELNQTERVVAYISWLTIVISVGIMGFFVYKHVSTPKKQKKSPPNPTRR